MRRHPTIHSILQTSTWCLAIASGCQPPPELLGTHSESVPEILPFIEILYPEPQQEILLDADCVLREPIVVRIEGLELVDAVQGAPNIEGQGHWHGGPTLEDGYCATSIPVCEGDDSDESNLFYDGSGMTVGSLNLYVSLNNNQHVPLGPVDEIVVELIAERGSCGATEE